MATVRMQIEKFNQKFCMFLYLLVLESLNAKRYYYYYKLLYLLEIFKKFENVYRQFTLIDYVGKMQN